MPPKKSSKTTKAPKQPDQEPVKSTKSTKATEDKANSLATLDLHRQKIPMKLHLKDMKLNHFRKAYALRIRNWKSKNFYFYVKDLTASISEASVGKRNKKDAFENQMKTYIARC